MLQTGMRFPTERTSSVITRLFDHLYRRPGTSRYTNNPSLALSAYTLPATSSRVVESKVIVQLDLLGGL
jgi:hypothetical protein